MINDVFHSVLKLVHAFNQFRSDLVFSELFEDEQKNSPSKCECPVPCSRSVYDTTVSYGTISQFDTAQEGRRRGDSVTRERFIRVR